MAFESQKVDEAAVQTVDVQEDQQGLEGKLAFLQSKVRETRQCAVAYRDYCSTQNVPDDNEGLQIAEELIQLVERKIAECIPLALTESDEIMEYGQQVDHFRRLFRSLLHTIVTAGTSLDWGAASQKQSQVPMGFHLGCPGADIPYVRYGSRQLEYLESELKKLLGFDADKTSLLMTSSGMSAYQLVESYLMRRVLSPGDRILTVGFIYFETKAQLTGLPGFHLRAKRNKPSRHSKVYFKF